MNDRELLEKAARAVGFQVDWDGRQMLRAEPYRNYINWEPWNPAKHNEDAMQLLIKLREKYGAILLALFEDRIECGTEDSCLAWQPIVNLDIGSATRIAITRAAAAMCND